jgi:hypothetical protein
MPVESYSPEGTRYGWACVEENCWTCGPIGPGFETKEEAADALDRHMNDEHYNTKEHRAH